MADAASERVSGPEEKNEPIPRVERAAVFLPPTRFRRGL